MIHMLVIQISIHPKVQHALITTTDLLVLEEAVKKGQQGEIFKISKELSGKCNSRSSIIKDKNRNKITLDEKQL